MFAVFEIFTHERFPSWPSVLLVLLVLLAVGLVVAVGLLVNSVVTVCQVEVDSGVESVLLPCRTSVHLPEDVRVEWRIGYTLNVHVYENGSDRPDEQVSRFRGRTEVKEDLLETKDLSLTLKYPTDRDGDVYSCTAYSRWGSVLMRKQVELRVKDCQVEVEEGAESVQLPFKTTADLPEDAEVRWRRFEPRPTMTAHVFQHGADQPEEQDERFRGRTEVKEDLLETGDPSLTLRRPTEGDGGRYNCTVYSREGYTMRDKTVLLRVKERSQIEKATVNIWSRSIILILLFLLTADQFA